MLEILGFRRIIVIAFLLCLNILLAAACFLYFKPHNVDLLNQLQTLTSQVSSKRADATAVEQQYQSIEDQKVYFSNLQTSGFFGDQSRTLVRERITDLQKFSNVLSAKYNVTAAQIEHNSAADDAGYVVLNSPVTITLDAFDDTDVYTFVYWLENAFPGQVSMTKLDISRPVDINQTTLKQIGNGEPIVLIHGELSFDWRTMVPSTQVAATASAPKG